jgi:hypothetical protein
MKESGSAHAANAPVDSVHFHLRTGQELVREFESSPGKFRAEGSAHFLRGG